MAHSALVSAARRKSLPDNPPRCGTIAFPTWLLNARCASFWDSLLHSRGLPLTYIVCNACTTAPVTACVVAEPPSAIGRRLQTCATGDGQPNSTHLSFVWGLCYSSPREN